MWLVIDAILQGENCNLFLLKSFICILYLLFVHEWMLYLILSYRFDMPPLSPLQHSFINLSPLPNMWVVHFLLWYRQSGKPTPVNLSSRLLFSHPLLLMVRQKKTLVSLRIIPYTLPSTDPNQYLLDNLSPPPFSPFDHVYPIPGSLYKSDLGAHPYHRR